MALNLNVLAGNTVVEQKMYNITIDGVDFGKLTESDTEKLIGIIKGFQSGNKPVQQNLAPQQSTSNKKSDKDFPDLGEPSAVIGNVTVYDDVTVRYWEKGFVPDKVKYGIKMSLRDAGAEWNKDKGAFTFKTKKACAEWCKAQKARASK